MHEINGEQAFPIYKFTAKWMEGKEENGTSKYVMFKEELSDKGQRRELKSYLKTFQSTPNGLEGKIEFVEYETWCLLWFQHQRFDLNETDEMLLKSFENYVARQIKAGKRDQLMGADDRFRWRSGSKTYESIPCRCVHCKMAGMVRIAH